MILLVWYYMLNIWLARLIFSSKQQNVQDLLIKPEIIKSQRNIQFEMHRAQMYDSKSSIFSAEYKIPYDCSQNSQIVEHLQQSQEQLEFLKQKLTQLYQKLQQQINSNIKLHSNVSSLEKQLQKYSHQCAIQQQQNYKLKQIMQTSLKNRKMLQDQVEYTHCRYKKLLSKKQNDHSQQLHQLQKQIIKLKKQNQFMEEQMSGHQHNNIQNKQVQMHNRQMQMHNKQLQMQYKQIQIQNKQYQQQMQSLFDICSVIMQNQIKKISQEKVIEVSRLRHEIQAYQRSLSPVKQFGEGIHSRTTNLQTLNQSNKQNTMLQVSTIQIQNADQSQAQEESIGKWKKSKMIDKPIMIDKPVSIANIQASKRPPTDDQRLTKLQMEKKNIQNKLLKIQRLKRHTPEDRDVMDQLEKKLYDMDSEISGLKRKIRQKY